MCGFDLLYVFFFKQKTAYEMRISDWSSDVCSSDLSSPRSQRGKAVVEDHIHDGSRVARIVGKSFLGSAEAIEIIADQRHEPVIFGARDCDQAALVFNLAWKMSQLSPELTKQIGRAHV